MHELGCVFDRYLIVRFFACLNVILLNENCLQVLDEYQKNFGDSWRSVQADGSQPWPYLNDALARFQVRLLCYSNLYLELEVHIVINFILHLTSSDILDNSSPLSLSLSMTNTIFLSSLIKIFQDPAEADKLMKIQRELDETKIILVSTIAVL